MKQDNNICRSCRWYDTEGERCTEPTLTASIWNNIAEPCIEDRHELQAISHVCTQTELRNKTAAPHAAPILAELRGRCNKYSAKSNEYYCEGCIYFVAGEDNDPDICNADPSESDMTADANQVITHCKLYNSLPNENN